MTISDLDGGIDRCVLALDLGTSSFKCAPVLRGELLAEPIELPYYLDHWGSFVTLNYPEEYTRLALAALHAGAEQARRANLEVGCIGICSQAQTFVGLTEDGRTTGPAIVWLDTRANKEAAQLKDSLRDFPSRTGFPEPNLHMFMLKVLHESRHGRAVPARGHILLLNELIIMRLTGSAYGDRTLQGMGGFYDISATESNDDYIELAGISKEQLVRTYPAAKYSQPLLLKHANDLGVAQIPVFSCGNDQCCSAIGAGVTSPRDALCNFGTAMVVYTVQNLQPVKLEDGQIAGIDPLAGGCFLLGYDPHCGILVENTHCNHGGSIDEMIRNQESSEVREMLADLSNRFWKLLTDLVTAPRSARLIASGGLSRSRAWLDYLEQAHGIRFERAAHEHSSLLGIARVVERHWNNADGA